MQEVYRGLPGSGVRQWIISHARIAQHINVLVGETVERAAINADLPIYIGLRHLFLKSGDVDGRHQRVKGSCEDRHARLRRPV